MTSSTQTFTKLLEEERALIEVVETHGLVELQALKRDALDRLLRDDVEPNVVRELFEKQETNNRLLRELARALESVGKEASP